jgi:succinate dehydrogenase / fumarate reductase iron-sulfur subunit
MRKFKDGDTIHVEPWRAGIPRDQGPCVDRGAFDRIQAAGGFVSVNTSGNLVDGNAVPIPKDDADKAFDAATCIGCGACVATCPNSSAMLFVAAKVSQFALLPQGRPEAKRRLRPWWSRWTRKALATAATPVPAKWNAPKASAWSTSHG